MNILFLSIGKLDDLSLKALYPDLIRTLAKNNNMYIVSCLEKRTGIDTYYTEECGCKVLRVKTGNITHTNLIEKAFSMMLLEGQFLKAIKKYMRDISFDLIIYTTPPINFGKVVSKIKKRDNAKTYLLLKDIFPQNAVDLQMFSKVNPIYIYYRMKEKTLYRISDYIGCMSKGNVDYILRNNPDIRDSIVEICPNSIEVLESTSTQSYGNDILDKYGIPSDRVKFVYGGNLGKPQGIDFLIEVLNAMKKDSRVFFMIVGTGTEFGKLQAYIDSVHPENVKLIKELPRDDYQKLVEQFDIGLIFLDKRFTIPNIPSRILSYMQASKPVFAITDKNTDLSDIIIEGEFGWWAASGDIENVKLEFEKILNSKEMLTQYGKNGRDYLKKNFTAQHSADIILKHFKEN